MSGEWWIALFSLIGTAIGSLSGMRLTSYRLKQLEDKVNKHNNLVERTYKIEESIAVIDEKIEVANNRIRDLEK